MMSRASVQFAKILESCTQQEVADAIGAKQQAVSAWSRGENRPGGKNMVRLEERYQIKPSDWYKPAETEQFSDETPEAVTVVLPTPATKSREGAPRRTARTTPAKPREGASRRTVRTTPAKRAKKAAA
jgi:transcriptional regulator with XRE-family HTH domain